MGGVCTKKAVDDVEVVERPAGEARPSAPEVADIEDLPRPTCAGLGPCPVDLKPGGGPAFLGGKYAWCTCGLSKSQPFCDGSHRKIPGHKGPLVFEASEEKTAYLCNCKATKNPPYCDGSHRKLTEANVGKPLPEDASKSVAGAGTAAGGAKPSAAAAADIEDLPRPTCAGLGPCKVELKPGGGPSFLGGKYAWCTCGLSKSQPFCDGSHRKIPGHKGPVVFEASEEKTAYLCNCKATKNPPYCDGSHRKLAEANVGRPLPEDAVQKAAGVEAPAEGATPSSLEVADIEDLPRPTCAGLGPCKVELKPGGGPAFLGGRYAWCTCGLSKSQPFCDGSHKKVPGQRGPLVFEVTEEKTAYLCQCKATKNPPYCDGSHAKLTEDNLGTPLPA